MSTVVTHSGDLIFLPEGDDRRIRVVRDRVLTGTARPRWRVWLPTSDGGVLHGYNTWDQARRVAFFNAEARPKVSSR